MKKKRRVKILGFALILMLLAGSFTACSDKKQEEEEIKKKVEDANKKVEKLEEEDKKKDEFVFREEENGAVLTKYNGTDKEVIIPEEYNGLAVVKIEEYTFREKTADIQLIQIPATVKEIKNQTLREGSSIAIRGYSDTCAEWYAARLGLAFESMGENTREADMVTIWDKDAAHCTNLYRGQMIDDEKLKGVTFKQVDGKSVLVLDNCDIGSVEVNDFAALTIELAEGSQNKIAGERGKSGISTNGKLTIKGSGKLSVFGADYFHVPDGANSGTWIGEGLNIWGNLGIEENAQVYVKGGNGKGETYTFGAYIAGNLMASGGVLEVVSGENEKPVPALIVSSVYEGRGGEILLDGVNITGGGQIAPVVYRGTDEDTGEAYEYKDGVSISGEAEVSCTQEEGYKGASTHIIIGQ